jgi:uncharacterized delta-60 repeat protein
MNQMRTLFSCLFAFLLCCTSTAQNEGLDLSFNFSGILSGNPGNANDQQVKLLRRPDGRLIVVGNSYYSNRFPEKGYLNATVAQWLSDGAADTNFGQAGRFSLDNKNMQAIDACLAVDGNLYLVGVHYIALSQPYELFVAKIKPDGTLDQDFGNLGFFTWGIVDVYVKSYTVSILSNGDIVVGGSCTQPDLGDQYGFLFKLSSDGNLVNGFGDNGKLFLHNVGSVTCTGIGKADKIYAGSGFGHTIMRLNGNGIMDSSFANNGFLWLPTGYFNRIIEGNDGNIWTGGNNNFSAISGLFAYQIAENGKSYTQLALPDFNYSNRWFSGMDTLPDGRLILLIQRSDSLHRLVYLQNGTLDVSQKRVHGAGPGLVFFPNMLTDADASIIVIGNQKDEFKSNDLVLRRFDPSFVPDSTFTAHGTLKFGMGQTIAAMHHVFTDAQGKILLSGASVYYDPLFDINRKMGYLTRLNPDGAPDADFGVSGIIRSSLSAYYLDKIAIQQNGNIIAAGDSFANGYVVIRVARLLKDGRQDLSFGIDQNGGVMQYFPNSLYSNVSTQAVGLDGADNIYVAVVTKYQPEISNIVLLKFTQNGLIDAGFGQNGKLQLGIAYPKMVVKNIQLMPDGRMLLAGNFNTTSDSGAFVLRLLPDGTADPTFGQNGVLVIAAWLNNGKIERLTLQTDSKLLLLGTARQPSGQSDIVLHRLLETGLPDVSFGENGVFTLDTGEEEQAGSLAFDADNRIMISGQARESTNAMHSDVLFVRIRANGRRDSTFAENAVLRIPFQQYAQISAIAIQPDGNYLGAGYLGNEHLVLRVLSNSAVGTFESATSILNPIVYPNPVESAFKLQYELPGNSFVFVTLYDPSGRICHQLLASELRFAGTNIEILTLPIQLASGMYYLHLRTDFGEQTMMLFMCKPRN